MERTDTSIKVWYWLRNAGNVPSDVRKGSSTINTSNWVSSLLLLSRHHFTSTARRSELGESGLKASRSLLNMNALFLFFVFRASRSRTSRTQTATSRSTLARTTSSSTSPFVATGPALSTALMAARGTAPVRIFLIEVAAVRIDVHLPLAYVNQNPSAFSNAYFDIAWLKIYE